MLARIERGKDKGATVPQYDVIGAGGLVLHLLHVKYCVQVHHIRTGVTSHTCATAAIKNLIVQLVAK